MAVPKLPLVLFSEQAMNKSPEHSGILTPPLHTLASVPFRWEEQPGKPRPCTDIITLPTSVFDEPKCLEPPPRLLYLEFTKTPSPTNNKLSSTSSFRFLKGRVEKGQLGSLVVYKNNNKVRRGGHWWQRYVKRKGKAGNRENVGGGSFVFPSSSSVDSSNENGGSGSDDQGVKMSRLKRNGSFSSLSQSSRSHIWGAIYEGFKQVIPWKSKKSKKEVLNL